MRRNTAEEGTAAVCPECNMQVHYICFKSGRKPSTARWCCVSTQELDALDPCSGSDGIAAAGGGPAYLLQLSAAHCRVEHHLCAMWHWRAHPVLGATRKPAGRLVLPWVPLQLRWRHGPTAEEDEKWLQSHQLRNHVGQAGALEHADKLHAGRFIFPTKRQFEEARSKAAAGEKWPSASRRRTGSATIGLGTLRTTKVRPSEPIRTTARPRWQQLGATP